MRLLVAGGGTGGHLYPGVAVAEELLSRGGHEVRFAGSANGIEARILPTLGLDFTPVRCGALVGKGIAGKVGGLASTFLGICDALGLISKFNPDACLGVGGYASFPVATAARMKGVFTAIQEQNATPGLANRALSGMAEKIYASDGAAAKMFPQNKTLVTGTPIRNGFKAPFPYEPPKAGEPTRVLVLGGSQGAAALNRVVPEALGLVRAPLVIRHQAGRGKEEAVVTAYAGRQGVSVEPFIMDMAKAYSWAQIVVARAGALTLAELEGAGRPAVLVPFPFAAANHQEANARAYEAKGCGVCVVERELSAEGLAKLLSRWIAEPSIPAGIAARAAAAAQREAAKTIVDDLIAHAGRGS